MAIQNIFNTVKGRVETARKQSREAFKAYMDTQKKALDVVSANAQSLAKTEIGAAKDVYAAAKASFEKARQDGVRQVASKPQDYVPASRDTVVSAYKETLDLLVKTGNELSTVVNKGYKSVRDKLTGKKPAARKTAAKRKSTTTTRKTTARKSTARKSAATRKSGNGTAATTASS
ncbi:hypothetical protein PC39_03457 [Salinisphaera sp. PC39]|uniref:hypothetical protein n=1 Tax=Salinisphaera sp. PC39 TaxID=1304156 RepID=UPI00333E52DA